MPERHWLPIEDYALIGNTHTAALVGRNGSIDWLCLPCFDSPACFAALLGTPDNGRWQIAPEGGERTVTRRYRGDTLVLETLFRTEDGEVALIDFMPVPEDERRIDLVRVVEGRRGRVPMRIEAEFRFDYGRIVPWLRRTDIGASVIAGPDAAEIRTAVPLEKREFLIEGRFPVEAGDRIPFVLTWRPSHHPSPPPLDPDRAQDESEAWAEEWSSVCRYSGEARDAVVRSLLTLKALTYAPTGAIVAAPTTSLPEMLGGVRNWDYRYCWLRDATLTLYALMSSGHTDEARAWREWLLRAVAGRPEELQIMYGIRGERRLHEFELPWLCGYENSRPVRIGNAAYRQLQIDVYGEVMDALHAARRHKVEAHDDAWRVQKVMMDFLESNWDQPDEGIWEVRGPKRHFTHSKVMAWVAMDRAVKAVECYGLNGPVERWRALREAIHAAVCAKGYDSDRNTFVQSYGARDLDAALLMIPLVGFLPADDPRVAGTVEAIERELTEDGFVHRYPSRPDVDGLPAGEGAFLACSFWMVDALAMIGRREEAVRMFRRLLDLRNDVGLLAEEYDPRRRRQLGNFPQAFSHIALVNSAQNLFSRGREGPSQRREMGEPDRAAPGYAEAGG